MCSVCCTYACCVLSAAQEQARLAIVTKWEEESGRRDAPVERLVRAVKFAVALAQGSANNSRFAAKAVKLKMYMQNSVNFGKHFGPGR